jgi:hypothetical protein
MFVSRGVDVWYRYIYTHKHTHTLCGKYLHTYTHPYRQDCMSGRSCGVFVWIVLQVHLCLFACTLCRCVVYLRLYQCAVHDTDRYVHTHIHTVTRIYTRPYRQDYMSGHSCVCLYESGYMYKSVSFHACCSHVLCVCVSVPMCTCMILTCVHTYT